MNNKKEKRAETEHQVMEAIRKRRFKEACQLVAVFEAEQVLARGMGIDWGQHDSSREVAILRNLFDGVPKKLTGIEPALLESLRVAAGMMCLWGTNKGKKWLPAGKADGLGMDADIVIRQLESYAVHREQLANYRRSGVKVVEIQTANDSHVCDVCRKLASKLYKLSEVPELPYEKCTCKLGCRCGIAGTDEGM